MVPYKGVTFESLDPSGNVVYHTNCVMAILDRHVVLCLASIRDEERRRQVVEEITEGKREIIDISYDEMMNMCGNMLMVRNQKGEHFVLMSERARKNLREENLKKLIDNYTIISSDLSIIETIGGGSARCMVAELF